MRNSFAHRTRAAFSGHLDEASLRLVIVSALASLMLLLRDAIVVSRLGLSAEMDGYVAATTAFLLAGLALVSAAESSVVPELARLRSRHPGAEVDFMSAVLLASIVAGLLLAVVLVVLAPTLASLLQSGSTEGQFVTTTVLRWLAVAGGMAVVIRGASSAILTSYRRFIPATMSPVIGATFVGFVALIRPTPRSLAVAFGAGVLVEAMLLSVLAARDRSIHVRPNKRAWTALLAVAPRGGIALVSSIIFSLNPLIDLAVASRLEDGDGAILVTAGRIPLAVSALMVVGFVTPQYPRFADLFVSEGRVGLRDNARSQARFAGGIGVGIGILLASCSYPISLVLYSHGQVSSSGTGAISINMAVFSVTVPFFIAGSMCARSLIASGRVGTVLAISCGGVLVNVVGDFVLGGLLGVTGIALSTAVVYAATLAATYAAQ